MAHLHPGAVARIASCAATVAFSVLLATTPLHGQVLRGRLVEDQTSAVVRGADVVLVSADGREVRRAVSDTAGVFELRAPQAGSYTLTVAHVAYLPYRSIAIPLNRNEMTHVTIRLAANAIPLRPLVVNARRAIASGGLADFERRRTDPSRSGHFIAREDIVRRPISLSTTLLRPVAGLVLTRIGSDMGDTRERYIVQFQGTGEPCTANIFVDGLYIPQSADNTLDEWLDVDLLAGVEVYARAASAPPEYQRTNCGVVLFWTRAGAQPAAPRWGGSVRYILAGVAVVATLAAFIAVK